MSEIKEMVYQNQDKQLAETWIKEHLSALYEKQTSQANFLDMIKLWDDFQVWNVESEDNLTYEKARAILIFYYELNEPTEQQIAKFILYGKI